MERVTPMHGAIRQVCALGKPLWGVGVIGWLGLPLIGFLAWVRFAGIDVFDDLFRLIWNRCGEAWAYRLLAVLGMHLVNRLAREAGARGVHVRILSECQCLCTTMYRIDQAHLLWVLDHLAGEYSKDGAPKVVNAIRVHPRVREQALLAVERMLALKAGPAVVAVD